MPKGPNGQERPADSIGCAVMVGMIATGEVEEAAYGASKKVRGSAGGNARAAKLSGEERRRIANAAAQKRWHERSEDMTENNQLLRSLFGHTEAERTHVNIKFLRGTADDISPDDFLAQAANALVEVDSGIAEPDSAFAESFKQVEIVDFLNAL